MVSWATTQTFTDLTQAIVDHDATTVRQMLQGHADLLTIEDSYGQTALIYALDHAPELVDLFIENGSAVNHATHAGWTPLTYAIRAGDVNAVSHLLAAGADRMAMALGEDVNQAVLRDHPNAEIAKLLQPPAALPTLTFTPSFPPLLAEALSAALRTTVDMMNGPTFDARRVDSVGVIDLAGGGWAVRVTLKPFNPTSYYEENKQWLRGLGVYPMMYFRDLTFVLRGLHLNAAYYIAKHGSMRDARNLSELGMLGVVQNQEGHALLVEVRDSPSSGAALVGSVYLFDGNASRPVGYMSDGMLVPTRNSYAALDRFFGVQ